MWQADIFTASVRDLGITCDCKRMPKCHKAVSSPVFIFSLYLSAATDSVAAACWMRCYSHASLSFCPQPTWLLQRPVCQVAELDYFTAGAVTAGLFSVSMWSQDYSSSTGCQLNASLTNLMLYVNNRLAPPCLTNMVMAIFGHSYICSATNKLYHLLCTCLGIGKHGFWFAGTAIVTDFLQPYIRPPLLHLSSTIIRHFSIIELYSAWL